MKKRLALYNNSKALESEAKNKENKDLKNLNKNYGSTKVQRKRQ